MTDEKDRFHRIFEVLSREEFLKEPGKIVSFLLNYGFDRRRVNVLQSAIRYERKLFLEAIRCPEKARITAFKLNQKGVLNSQSVKIKFDFSSNLILKGLQLSLYHRTLILQN